jgi:hypothetical protein
MTNEQIADEICEAVIKECGDEVWIADGMSAGIEFRERIVKALEAKDFTIAQLIDITRRLVDVAENKPEGFEITPMIADARAAIEKAKGAVG